MQSSIGERTDETVCQDLSYVYFIGHPGCHGEPSYFSYLESPPLFITFFNIVIPHISLLISVKMELPGVNVRVS